MPSRLFFLLLSIVLAAPACADLGVNVYGLSYHVERGRAKEIGVDNEFNPGLGVRYRAPRQRWDWILDAGAYRDSGRNTALYAGAGALWKPAKSFGIGGALAVFDSDTYNRGRTFIAPVPMASWDFGGASLSVVYLPKVSDFNEINTFGFWLTIWPERF